MPENNEAIAKLESWIEGAWWMLPNLGLALVAFAVLALLGRMGRHLVALVLRRRGRENLGVLLGGFVQWATVVFGLLVVSAIVFPSIKPSDLLATLGVGSVAIGFAFKDILQNWLSGVLLLVRQPFSVGDQIVIGTFEGTVESIEARATLLKTYDGRRVVIPNSEVYTRSLVVNTAFAARRSEFDVGVGPREDLSRASEMFLGAVRRVAGVHADPAPDARPWDLGDVGTIIRVRWWTSPDWAIVLDVRTRVVHAIHDAALESGIDLPAPTRLVQLQRSGEDVTGQSSSEAKPSRLRR